MFTPSVVKQFSDQEEDNRFFFPNNMDFVFDQIPLMSDNNNNNNKDEFSSDEFTIDSEDFYSQEATTTPSSSKMMTTELDESLSEKKRKAESELQHNTSKMTSVRGGNDNFERLFDRLDRLPPRSSDEQQQIAPFSPIVNGANQVTDLTQQQPAGMYLQQLQSDDLHGYPMLPQNVNAQLVTTPFIQPFPYVLGQASPFHHHYFNGQPNGFKMQYPPGFVTSSSSGSIGGRKKKRVSSTVLIPSATAASVANSSSSRREEQFINSDYLYGIIDHALQGTKSDIGLRWSMLDFNRTESNVCSSTSALSNYNNSVLSSTTSNSPIPTTLVTDSFHHNTISTTPSTRIVQQQQQQQFDPSQYFNYPNNQSTNLFADVTEKVTVTYLTPPQQQQQSYNLHGYPMLPQNVNAQLATPPFISRPFPHVLGQVSPFHHHYLNNQPNGFHFHHQQYPPPGFVIESSSSSSSNTTYGSDTSISSSSIGGRKKRVSRCSAKKKRVIAGSSISSGSVGSSSTGGKRKRVSGCSAKKKRVIGSSSSSAGDAGDAVESSPKKLKTPEQKQLQSDRESKNRKTPLRLKQSDYTKRLTLSGKVIVVSYDINEDECKNSVFRPFQTRPSNLSLFIDDNPTQFVATNFKHTSNSGDVTSYVSVLGSNNGLLKISHKNFNGITLAGVYSMEITVAIDINSSIKIQVEFHLEGGSRYMTLYGMRVRRLD